MLVYGILSVLRDNFNILGYAEQDYDDHYFFEMMVNRNQPCKRLVPAKGWWNNGSWSTAGVQDTATTSSDEVVKKGEIHRPKKTGEVDIAETWH